LLDEREGAGRAAAKGDRVVYNIAVFLNRGGEVPINEAQAGHGLPPDRIRREDGRLFIDHRITLGGREAIPGIERSLVGMKAGGHRRVRIGPHLAFRDRGVPGLIPADAVLVVDIWLRQLA